MEKKNKFKITSKMNLIVYWTISIIIPLFILGITRLINNDVKTLVFLFVMLSMYVSALMMISPILKMENKLKHAISIAKEATDYKGLVDRLNNDDLGKIKNLFEIYKKSLRSEKIITENGEEKILLYK